jgi:hypothetical protein
MFSRSSDCCQQGCTPPIHCSRTADHAQADHWRVCNHARTIAIANMHKLLICIQHAHFQGDNGGRVCRHLEGSHLRHIYDSSTLHALTLHAHHRPTCRSPPLHAPWPEIAEEQHVVEQQLPNELPLSWILDHGRIVAVAGRSASGHAAHTCSRTSNVQAAHATLQTATKVMHAYSI